jgi:hypothetical protein
VISRRAALKAAMAAPLAGLVTRAEARDYTSAGEVFAEIDRLEADLDARLASLAARFPAAAAFARSVRGDHDRHRRSRAALRRRLRLGEAAPAAVPGGATSVDALRALVQDLVYAHAEGMPALRDARAVDALARAMVDDARHLAVLQMWMETEQPDA